jgi:hypothetical protein
MISPKENMISLSFNKYQWYWKLWKNDLDKQWNYLIFICLKTKKLKNIKLNIIKYK